MMRCPKSDRLRCIAGMATMNDRRFNVHAARHGLDPGLIKAVNDMRQRTDEAIAAFAAMSVKRFNAHAKAYKFSKDLADLIRKARRRENNAFYARTGRERGRGKRRCESYSHHT